MRPLVRFGQRLGRDASVYATGFAITLSISLVSVAVLTRFLDPSQFGELAVLLFFAALLTVLYNLGLLQGSLAWVFGASGDEEAEAPSAAEGPADRRRALGAAIVLTAAVALAGSLIVIPVAAAGAGILALPGSEAAIAVAAASGALGSVWRLLSNVPRLERRPRAFVLLSAVRPILVLAITVPLVATGGGVEGAISGVAIGTGLACLVALIAIRGSFRLSLPRTELRPILRVGMPFVPVIASFWVIQNVDLYVLSTFASDEDVGLYRLASRVGVVISYFVSAFLMAWGPLTLTSVFIAAAKEHGPTGVGSRLTSYYAIVGAGLLLVLAVGSDLLIKIAPPTYTGAAGLVPVLGAGFLAYGGFIVLYRAARFPRRRVFYATFAAASAAIFLPLVIALTAAFGAYGTAVASIVAFGAASLGIVWKSQRGPEPIEFERGRIAAAFAIALACFALSRLAIELPAGLREGLSVVAILAYPALILATGAVPRRDLPALKQVALGLVPDRIRAGDIGAGLARLDPGERGALAAVLREGETPAAVAERLGTSRGEAERRLVLAVAEVAGIDPPGDVHPVAAFLFTRGSVAERDALARKLWEDGFDPNVLDLLDETCVRLRAVPRRAWAPTVAGPPS